MEILISLLLLLAGVVLMSNGSDWLTESLSPIARRLRVSGAAAGLILVSVAVSLPEIFVTLYAGLRGHPQLGLGVILGSVVCNIGLMTGLCAIVRPLKIDRTILLRDGIFALAVPILVFAVASGGAVTRLEGSSFLMLFGVYVLNVYLQEQALSSKRRREDIREAALELKLVGFDIGTIAPGWLSFVLGVAVLLGGTHLFGGSMIDLSERLGIPELIVGLTVGAIGTTLPNIFAAYKATKRGLGDLVVSETLGSNIFTLLVTLGLAAMVGPLAIDTRWLLFDFPALIVMSALLLLFLSTRLTLSRREGAVLLAGYVLTMLVQLAI